MCVYIYRKEAELATSNVELYLHERKPFRRSLARYLGECADETATEEAACKTNTKLTYIPIHKVLCIRMKSTAFICISWPF